MRSADERDEADLFQQVDKVGTEVREHECGLPFRRLVVLRRLQMKDPTPASLCSHNRLPLQASRYREDVSTGGLEHTKGLGQRGSRIRYVFKDMAADDEIESIVGKRKPLVVLIRPVRMALHRLAERHIRPVAGFRVVIEVLEAVPGRSHMAHVEHGASTEVVISHKLVKAEQLLPPIGVEDRGGFCLVA